MNVVPNLWRMEQRELASQTNLGLNLVEQNAIQRITGADIGSPEPYRWPHSMWHIPSVAARLHLRTNRISRIVQIRNARSIEYHLLCAERESEGERGRARGVACSQGL